MDNENIMLWGESNDETIAPETVKTAENDNFHITVNDNGCCIISDKGQGRIFFEMFTVMLSNESSVGYNTHASVIKTVTDELSAFDIVQCVPIPFDFKEAFVPCELKYARFFIRVMLGRTDGSLKFSFAFNETEQDVTLRFPTGIEYPVLTGHELNSRFGFDGSLTVSDEAGMRLTLISSSKDVLASVSHDGNVDLIFTKNTESYTDSVRYFEFELKA